MVLIVSIGLSYTYTMVESSISKKESDCMPPWAMAIRCPSSRFDFENLTQSEARELPTSGHKV